MHVGAACLPGSPLSVHFSRSGAHENSFGRESFEGACVNSFGRVV
jgi:hypothetical protein